MFSYIFETKRYIYYPEPKYINQSNHKPISKYTILYQNISDNFVNIILDKLKSILYEYDFFLIFIIDKEFITVVMDFILFFIMICLMGV